ncbi:MAG: inositol monophosphatase [Anaerolineaceae bacterium]
MTVDLPSSSSGRSPLEVAHLCSDAAGEAICAGFGATGIAATKGRGNVVTEVDFEAERRTFEILRREYPNHAVLSEETAAATRSDGWLWICDPLDGTKNFSRGIPHFAFSIALCFGGEPVVALTSHPLLGEATSAVAGQGCTLNLGPAVVSNVPSVQAGVIGIDLGYDNNRGGYQLGLAQHLWPSVQGIRAMGSAALGFAFVAAGRWDAYVHSDLQPWDIAAGLLLVREAGGTVTDRKGGPATIWTRAAIAGNPTVHDELAMIAAKLPWHS